jgi:hypothetical protein
LKKLDLSKSRIALVIQARYLVIDPPRSLAGLSKRMGQKILGETRRRVLFTAHARPSF